MVLIESFKCSLSSLLELINFITSVFLRFKIGLKLSFGSFIFISWLLILSVPRGGSWLKISQTQDPLWYNKRAHLRVTSVMPEARRYISKSVIHICHRVAKLALISASGLNSGIGWICIEFAILFNCCHYKYLWNTVH